MKKFFTLIVAFMATLFSANAAEVVLFEGSEALGWGGAELDVAGITENSGLTLHVTIETTSGDWWQFKFAQSKVTDWPAIQLIEGKDFVTASDVSYSWSAGTYTYDFELTDEQIALFKAGSVVQGSISNNGELDPAPQLLLKKVTVESKVNYKEAVDITEHMDQYGQILSKYFNGFSDDAVVEFTWNSTNTSGAIGWGAGSLKSIDGTVDLKEAFNVQGEGANVVNKKLGDLKEALNAGPDQYNRYGLTWSIWGTGGSSNERVSVKVYEVEGFDGEGYLSPDSQVTPPSGDSDKKEGYQDPVNITDKMDQYGNIESKYFNGFSDDAIIVFTWESTGDEAKGKIGWGAGSLKSLDGTVDLEEGFNIKNEGVNTVEKTLGEIKAALNAGPSEYNQYGINWNMWSFDGCTNTRVSVKIYEVEGFNGEGYKDPVTTAIKNVETTAQNAAMYNVAGQRVQNANGLVIINGKKYVK